jgi:hypothetical protein
VNERSNLLLKLPKCSHVSRQRRARILLVIAQFIYYLWCLVSCKSSRAPRCTVPERIAFLLKLPKCSYVSRQPADFLQGFCCCRVLGWGGGLGARVCSVAICCMVGLRLGGHCVLTSCPASPTLSFCGDIMQQLCIASFLLVLPAAAAQQYVAFDAASASSTYSVGNLAGSPAFAAQQTLSGGSGYWQSFLT